MTIWDYVDTVEDALTMTDAQLHQAAPKVVEYLMSLSNSKFIEALMFMHKRLWVCNNPLGPKFATMLCNTDYEFAKRLHRLAVRLNEDE